MSRSRNPEKYDNRFFSILDAISKTTDHVDIDHPDITALKRIQFEWNMFCGALKDQVITQENPKYRFHYERSTIVTTTIRKDVPIHDLQGHESKGYCLSFVHKDWLLSQSTTSFLSISEQLDAQLGVMTTERTHDDPMASSVASSPPTPTRTNDKNFGDLLKDLGFDDKDGGQPGARAREGQG